jgi:hypothetical protein
MSTNKRGRILRDTTTGDGLIYVEGQQYTFRLETVWKSEFAPKVNAPVDAEFDEQERLIAVRAVGGQSIPSEQAAQAFAATHDAAKKFAAEFQARGLPVVTQYAQKIGYPTLGALAAVLLGWFVLPAASMNMGLLGKNSLTFYQSLKLLNAEGLESLAALGGGGSAGIYGLLCFLAIIAVLLPFVWPDRRAALGMAAPLALMLLVTVVAYAKVASQFSAGAATANAFGGAEMQAMAQQAADQAAAEFRKAISLGFGMYLSFAGGLYLAWQGVRKAHRPVQ